MYILSYQQLQQLKTNLCKQQRDHCEKMVCRHEGYIVNVHPMHYAIEPDIDFAAIPEVQTVEQRIHELEFIIKMKNDKIKSLEGLLAYKAIRIA